MYIFVPVFWNKASSPVPTSFFSPTLNWTTFFSSFLLYRAFLAKERNLMHRNILLRISYLLQRSATHLLRIFKGTFFTIEKDTTKSLGLRGIRVLEATSEREEQNGGKFRKLEKIIKKIAFDRNQNFFRETSLLYMSTLLYV